ncbi:hypothetical protein [Streptomyces sp. NPDC048350]|uniref:hypothetical protein n=1 Tax=Streptomyces sp. NPDC048350 TaxID=3365538 RepID=UPI00371BD077
MTMPSRPDSHGPLHDRGRDPHKPDGTHEAEAAAGIAQLEGYLLAHQAQAEAGEAGAAFARRFPWMGPQEQSDVARAFAQEHLAVRLHMFRAAVARADELKGQYSHRYECLRRRLVATVLSLATVGTVVLSVMARGTG